MEIIQLLSFYQIVKTGSFSKASKKIFRTQSAVSHQIKNLENEFKVKLFERLGKRAILTKEGEILFDIIGKFFNDLENLKKIYNDIQYGKGGSLTIAASSAVMRYLLPDVIKMFIKKFPRINFKLITCNLTSEIQSLIFDGEADFGIGLTPNQLLPQKINFLLWQSCDMFLILAKDHPLSQKGAIQLEDISSYPLITYRKGTTIRKIIEDTFAKNKLSYEIIMEMDVAENIKTYVEMGIGLSILSSLILTPEDKKRFAIFNVTNLFGNVTYGIYYRKDKYISTAMKQFIKFFSPELINKFASQYLF